LNERFRDAEHLTILSSGRMIVDFGSLNHWIIDSRINSPDPSLPLPVLTRGRFGVPDAAAASVIQPGGSGQIRQDSLIEA
jgi:hypothetical protein